MHLDALAQLFLQVLRLCQKSGLVKLGHVALDGTKIKAHASMRDIMELLESGKSVLASLTIPEGLTVEQAFQRIAAHEALTGDMRYRPSPWLWRRAGLGLSLLAEEQ